MNKKWYDTFLLYSQMDEYKQKIEDAKQIIIQAKRKYKKPYIAFSGGKDSLVMMDIVLSIIPNCVVFHWDYGSNCIPNDYYIEIIDMIKRKTNNFIIAPEGNKRNKINIFGNDFLEKYVFKLIDDGFDCCFIGLRKEEGCGRKNRIKADRSLTRIKEIFPVQNWSYMDIWAYIISNNIKYLSHYNKYGEVVGWDKVRYATLFDSGLDRLGCSNIDGVLSWRFKHE